MGDEDAGRAPGLHLLAQKPQHLSRALGIEIAGGLVGQDDLRSVDQCAGDRDALQFAAGQFARHARAALAETDGGEHRAHFLLRRRIGDADERQRQRDVLPDGQVRQHVEGLEDEAHLHAPERRQRIVVERREVDAVEMDRTGVGTIEPRDEIEQRGLADPRLAHHRDVVARPELEVDAVQDGASLRSCVGLRRAAGSRARRRA